MKNGNSKLLSGLIITLVLGSYAWTNKSSSDIKSDFLLDTQQIKVNIAQIDDRVRRIDKNITKINTLIGIVLRKYVRE